MEINECIEIDDEINQRTVRIYASTVYGACIAADINKKDAIKIIKHLNKVFNIDLKN